MALMVLVVNLTCAFYGVAPAGRTILLAFTMLWTRQMFVLHSSTAASKHTGVLVVCSVFLRKQTAVLACFARVCWLALRDFMCMQ